MVVVMNTDILYLQPETLMRLLTQERVMRREDGVATFRQDDHRFAGLPVMVASSVTKNAVHRRRWSPFERRFVFEYAGDV